MAKVNALTQHKGGSKSEIYFVFLSQINFK